MSIQLENYEMVLLKRTRGYGDFGDEDRERIFGEHLAYVLGLVSSGQQLAAGPVRDGPATGELICGLGLFQQGSLDAVRELMDNDPGIKQGLYCYDVMLWQTPAGRISFRNP
jgi:uncharacterized protein YciI